jgi:hypothetical protein
MKDAKQTLIQLRRIRQKLLHTKHHNLRRLLKFQDRYNIAFETLSGMANDYVSGKSVDLAERDKWLWREMAYDMMVHCCKCVLRIADRSDIRHVQKPEHLGKFFTDGHIRRSHLNEPRMRGEHAA